MKILTTGYWPTQAQTQQSILPTVALNAFNEFRDFYLAKHTGRQLTLQVRKEQIESISRILNNRQGKHGHRRFECSFLWQSKEEADSKLR